MNFTYDPLEFSIGMTMLLNNETIFTNTISGTYSCLLYIPRTCIARIPRYNLKYFS